MSTVRTIIQKSLLLSEWHNSQTRQAFSLLLSPLRPSLPGALAYTDLFQAPMELSNHKLLYLQTFYIFRIR